MEGSPIFPKVGTRCDIQLLNRKNWEDVQLKARVADIVGEDYFMELPVINTVVNTVVDKSNRMYVPRTGDRWRVFYTNSGALYRWDARVLNVVHTGLCLVHVSQPRSEDVSKIQRRDFLRMPIRLQVTLESEKGDYQLHGETINISGGGMAVRSHPDTPLKKGDILRGSLTLPPENKDDGAMEISVTVKTVRVDPGTSDGKPLTGYFQFIQLKPQYQAAIVRLCNRRQRELHLKGLKL